MEIRFPSWAELKEKILPPTKRPGWISSAMGVLDLIYHLIRWLLDWKSLAEEAVSTIEQLPFLARTTFAILVSPWFGVALVAVGLMYVLFVPADEQMSPHAVMAKWLAWGAVLLAFLALWSALLLGFFGTNSPPHLTRRQASRLTEVLGKGPDISLRIWIVSYPECFRCRAYAWEFATTMNEIPQWKHKVGVLPYSSITGGPQLSTLWRGVIVGSLDPKHLTENQAVLVKALRAADIHFSFEPIEFTLNQNGTKLEEVVLLIAPQKE
jgi:hypothetical protein